MRLVERQCAGGDSAPMNPTRQLIAALGADPTTGA